jgi:urease accessory protein
MDTFNSIITTPSVLIKNKLSLPFDKRQKSRQRAVTLAGEVVFIQLPRGTVMRDGQFLSSEQGQILEITAALESVSTVSTQSSEQLARLAYHLGNRHVALQVGSNWVRYLQDPVLDKMVAGLGLTVVSSCCPFEPEPGAYNQGGHSHHKP